MKAHFTFTGLRFSLARLMLLAMAVVLAAGSTVAHAQTGANIFAAAELLPVASEVDPNIPASGATFESRSGGGMIIRVRLNGVIPNQRYVVNIRNGDCEGAVLHTLVAVQTDAAGNGQSVSELDGAVGFGQWHVQANPEGAFSSAQLCGVVNPALAAPGGPAPGMPSTGGPNDMLLAVAALLGVAMLTVLLGRKLRAAA